MQQETINVLLDQKAALTVASATAFSGLASHYEIIEGWLSLTAIAVGILLTTTLIVHRIILSIKSLKEIKIMDEREKTRRKEDK